MTPKRFFYVMVGVLVLLIVLIIGSVAGGNALLQKEADKLIALKIQNKIIEKQEVSLVQAKKDVEKYADIDKIAKAIVPQDKDQAKTAREISQIASESGIELKTITFQTSSLGNALPTAPKTEESKTDTKTAIPAPALTQIKPVPGINGVYSLEITISPVEQRPVLYRDFLVFLERLENNRRTAHVEKISINPSKDGSSLTFTLTLNAYLKP